MNTETQELEPIEQTDEQHLQMTLAEAAADIANRQRILTQSEKLLRPLSRRLRERVTLNNEGFDLFNCTHDDAIEAMRLLGGGRWDKKVNSHHETCVDYTCRIAGLLIIIWGAQPPGSCRIVEEKIEVPAQTVIKRRLICAPGTQAA